MRPHACLYEHAIAYKGSLSGVCLAAHGLQSINWAANILDSDILLHDTHREDDKQFARQLIELKVCTAAKYPSARACFSELSAKCVVAGQS